MVASSSAVCGLKKGAQSVAERVALSMNMPSARLRRKLWRYDRIWVTRYHVWMFHLLGLGQSSDLACSAFARQIALAERFGQTEIVTATLDVSRDFLDVRDAARDFEAVAQKGKVGQIYNVSLERAVAM